MGTRQGLDHCIINADDESHVTVSFDNPGVPQRKKSQSKPANFTRLVTRSKSQASFVIPPYRTSSTVIASTGETVQREYSEWLRNPLSNLYNAQITNSTLNNSSPISHNEFITYLKSILTIPILKASFTYFIASLFVYSPYIASFLGTSDSKHIVCTVVVYFHSSRSIGSMIQSLLFVAISLIFGISVSVGTMKLISGLLNSSDDIIDHVESSSHPHSFDTDLETLSIIITLLISSSALGIISFFKHRISKPTFNTSCSLCAILIISCLIKEYSKIYAITDPNTPIKIPWDKIISSIECIITGCTISVFMCFTVWRQVAKMSLIDGLNDVEQSCGRALGVLCDAFMGNWKELESSPEEIDDPELELRNIAKAKAETQKIFNGLQTQIRKLDSSLEETLFESYASGREKEYHILKELVENEKKMAVNLGSLSRAVEFKWDILEEHETHRLQLQNQGGEDTDTDTNIDITEHDFMNVIDTSSIDSNSNLILSSNDTVEPTSDAVVEPRELFDLFFYHVGPSTRSFVFTMKDILIDPMFDSNSKVKTIVEQYDQSLNKAKDLYQEHQKNAIDSLYKQDIFTKEYNFNGKVSHEEIAATCANFAFSLTQFSLELDALLLNLKSLRDHYQRAPKKTFEFLKFWNWKSKHRSIPIDIELLDLERGRVFQKDLNQKAFSYKIWELTKFFRGIDFQFGLRVALGALLLGSFAFLPFTRHIFNEWRGEWVLVTFCIIMNKSLGGTVMTVKWRFLGTFVGAFTAYWVWVLFFPNVFLMALSGFIVSIPCFGIILNWKNNNAFGRFILLTYNLTVLYSYTMSLNSGPGLIDGNDDWEGGDNPIIFEIAFHRYIGVSAGVLWALIITLTLFPMSARARVKQGLTTLWLRMGLIWKSGPLSIKQTQFNESRLIGLNGLTGCHKIHSELIVLQKQAPMELELRDAYPTEKFQKLITCTSNILDSFENMNSIVEMDPMLGEIERKVLIDLQTEIKELQNRVFLMFYMLSSAMTLGLPLMAKAAGTEHAMEKVVVKLSDLRRQTIEIQQSNKETKEMLSNEEFVLFYTYCLVTEAIVKQLNLMMVEVVGLYNRLDEDLVELL